MHMNYGEVQVALATEQIYFSSILFQLYRVCHSNVYCIEIFCITKFISHQFYNQIIVMCNPIPLMHCEPCCCPPNICLRRRPAPCKSRELHAGILNSTCVCNRRHGLQDDCQRTACRGPVSCLLDQKPPVAVCCPSIYARRFEGITMGKPSNPTGKYMIRLVNNGTEAVQYDPRIAANQKCCKMCQCQYL